MVVSELPELKWLTRPYDEHMAERDREYYAEARLRAPVRAEELRCMNAWQELGDPREPWLVHCPRTHRFLGIGVYEIGPRQWDILKIVLPVDLSVQPAVAAGGWRHHPASAAFVPHQSQIAA